MTKTDQLSEQLPRAEVGQSDRDFSSPVQLNDWLYILETLETFRTFAPSLEKVKNHKITTHSERNKKTLILYQTWKLDK